MKINRPLFIPIFSMRSYGTGKYAVLKDGNFQLMMARVLASDFLFACVAIPEDCSDEVELRELYQRRPFPGKSISFVKMKYGKNAVETREQFWELNKKEIYLWEMSHQHDLIISDITGYPQHEFGFPHIIYNFNITKLPELDRPYIDKFFEQDLKSIEQSLFTTVINPRQREYILEVRPDLHDKVIAHYKVAHQSMLPMGVPPTENWSRGMKKIFWPFRISDKAYQFEQFIEAFDNLGLAEEGYTIDVTDPNDTLKITRPYLQKTKLSKRDYYEMLSNRFTIVMLDDIDTVLHPGTIEFFHYGCPVITYHSRLIDNPNGIDNLSELGGMLANVEYNAIDASPFVYTTGEVDTYYNQDFINVRKN